MLLQAVGWKNTRVGGAVWWELILTAMATWITSPEIWDSIPCLKLPLNNQ